MSGALRYLYGDSSQFPLHSNFLQTLGTATDAAVALLWGDVRIEKARRAMVIAATRANDDLLKLEELGQAVETVLTPYAGTGDVKTVREETARRLLKGSTGTMDYVRTQVMQWRDRAFKNAEISIGRDTFVPSLQDLVIRHELPDTQWEVHWKAVGEESVVAQAVAVTSIELTAEVDISIPFEHLWAKPVRVGSLVDGVVIHVQREAKLFRGPRLAQENLDKYQLCQVDVGLTEGVLCVRKTMKDGAPGFEFRVPFDPDGKVSMRPTVGAVPVDTSPETIESGDAATIRLLWESAEKTLRSMVQHRQRITSARFRDKTVEQLGRPGEVSEALVTLIAPLVREIKARSSGRGELNLKVEFEDKRREEIFVQESFITAKYAELPPEQRRVFDAFGLGEATIVPAGDEAAAEPLAEPRVEIEPPPEEDFEFDMVSEPEMVRAQRPAPAATPEPQYESRPDPSRVEVAEASAGTPSNEFDDPVNEFESEPVSDFDPKPISDPGVPESVSKNEETTAPAKSSPAQTAKAESPAEEPAQAPPKKKVSGLGVVPHTEFDGDPVSIADAEFEYAPESDGGVAAAAQADAPAPPVPEADGEAAEASASPSEQKPTPQQKPARKGPSKAAVEQARRKARKIKAAQEKSEVAKRKNAKKAQRKKAAKSGEAAEAPTPDADSTAASSDGEGNAPKAEEGPAGSDGDGAGGADKKDKQTGAGESADGDGAGKANGAGKETSAEESE